MKQQLNDYIKTVLKNLGIEAEAIVLEHPVDMTNGDYSTNVAMAYAKQLGKNPRELALAIKAEFEKSLPKEIEKVEVAGPGFINFYLSHSFFIESVKEALKQKEQWGGNTLSSGKKIMVEYTDPNPFKPFHIGHLMTNAIGESISRIVAFSGAETIRANYQGDVGLHVAKAIYGILNSDEYKSSGLPTSGSATESASWIGIHYAAGSDAYDADETVKATINTINKKVYEKTDNEINTIYDWGRKVTLEAFEEIYALLGTKFKHYFFESQMAPIGVELVKARPDVYEESDGAIVFHGEKYDSKLHTRVFINSQGLPTYETKELGLTKTKFEKENPDLSIVITAHEQADYMRVVEKSIEVTHPDIAARMKHITHGMMRLSSGKMSSRKGNVVTGESLLRDSIAIVEEKVKDREFSDVEKKTIGDIVGVAALKYSILRSSLGSDIVYDFEKSISFEGDSGPYLQYTAVRAQSILKKAEAEGVCAAFRDIPTTTTTLEKLLYQFPEVVSRAYTLLEPHHVATYLTELASAFNSFYGNTMIVNKSDPYANYRVALVEAFHSTMKNGLNLLGIQTPERM